MELPINYEKSHWSVRKQAREQYVLEQGGKCWYCKKLLISAPSMEVMCKPINHALFPKSMFKYPVHLHHDRTNGMTIGATHARCNAYLFQYLNQ